MFRIIRKYFINFWIWWYVPLHKRVLTSLIGYWNFTLGFFDIVPMLQNLFRPLFQDDSKEGKLIAFPIRLTWVLFGSFFQLIISIPLLAMYLAFLISPILPILAIVEYFVLHL